jgi:hypothetical protein
MYGGKSLLQKVPDDGLFFLDYIGYALWTVDLKSQAVARATATNSAMHLAHMATTRAYIHRHCEALTGKLSELASRPNQCVKDSDEYNKISKVIDKFIGLQKYHNRSILNIKGLEEFIIP